MDVSKQNEEQRDKLQDLETSQETTTQPTIVALEAKILQLQEQNVQNEELRAELQDLETSERTRDRATIAALEAKISQVKEQIDIETKERQALAKTNRRLEKRLEEAMMQLENERSLTDQFKEQVDKCNNKIKALTRDWLESDEKFSREKALRRKAEREVEDLVEANKALNREASSLKSRHGGAGSGLPT